MEAKRTRWLVWLAGLFAVLVVAWVAGRALRQSNHDPVSGGLRAPAADGPQPDRLASAELAPSRPVEERVEVAEVSEPELPGTGTLLGRLIVPAGMFPAGLRVGARPADLSPRARATPRLDGMVTLDAEGTFELGPLAAGEVTVLLYLPAEFKPVFLSSRASPLGAREIGVVTIPGSGAVEAEFQVFDIPGHVRVSVTSHGAPLSNVQVCFLTHDGDRVQTTTGVDGTTAWVPMFPAPWSVYVFDEEQGWARRHAEFVYIVAGSEQTVSVEVPLAEGTVTLIDELTREPLARRKVVARPQFEYESTRVGSFSRYRTTDAEGRLSLCVPPGKYRLELAEDDAGGDVSGRDVLLEWTDQGPARAEIDL